MKTFILKKGGVVARNDIDKKALSDRLLVKLEKCQRVVTTWKSRQGAWLSTGDKDQIEADKKVIDDAEFFIEKVSNILKKLK